MDCDLQIIQEAFEQMQTEMLWDTRSGLLYEHFFTDPDLSKLEEVAHFLEMSGYHVVNVYPNEDESSHFLQMALARIHTPVSLHAQNLEFNQVALSFKIESYDGWEAGPVVAGTTSESGPDS